MAFKRHPADAAALCLEKIRQSESNVQAWEYINEELVESFAADADVSNKDLPLYGVAVGVKDIFNTHDMPTRYGSRIYHDNRPGKDCGVVEILRKNGAIVVGKTVTTEFAAWPPSRTRNPRNTAYSPGGSSSGSAAAVAAGMVPIAIGSQTLGSVIRPASYCGVVGFKPSYSAISTVGVRPVAQSLDTVGIFAESVDLVSQVYRVLARKSSVPKSSEPVAMPKIGFCKGPAWKHANPDARAAMLGYVRALNDEGMMIDEIELPSAFEKLSRAAKTVHDYEFYRNCVNDLTRHRHLVSIELQDGLRLASTVTRIDYESSLEIGSECRAVFPRSMRGLDAVITLAATGEAPVGVSSTGSPIMNAAWTLLYAACASLPLLRGGAGLPIGVQVVAAQGRDEDLLRASSWLENATGQ